MDPPIAGLSPEQHVLHSRRRTSLAHREPWARRSSLAASDEPRLATSTTAKTARTHLA